MIQMSKVLLRPDEFSIDRETLKKDMRGVDAYYKAENQEVRQALTGQYRLGQPDGVFKHSMWGVANQPSWERDERNFSPEMTEEAKPRLADIAKPSDSSGAPA